MSRVDSSGVEIAVEWHPGPPGLALAMAHATGFCRGVWDPVIDELRARGVDDQIVSWDHRGHGESENPPLPIDWWDTARDVLAVLAGADSPTVGVGHSMGAAALLMAEILAPGTFAAIIAIEPIVFPPPYEPIDHHPLVQSANRRRPSFPSREAALENFASKEVFSGWDRRALEAYVACGLRADGEQWVLSCPPEYEAATFAAAPLHGAWDRLGDVTPPVLVVAGRDSDSHPAEFADAQADRLARGTLEIVDGSGHFLPMEQPGRVAAIIGQVISSIRSS
ncbi:MAG: alpha/beta hydrolase [Acidimicrobiia bacterium]|nr:alpha/beta hydrolase [Acidimicrobiia bacterium]NNL98111.1 alpha/beta hydrolase [Acidimicrobiia bacterium]